MAYVVPRASNRFELRESAWTPKGPRSRTLASFAQLTPEVIIQAAERSHGVITRSELVEAARRAGAPIPRPAADDAAVRLIGELEQGEELSPAIKRLLRDRLVDQDDRTERPVTHSERAAAGWLGRSLTERGEALRNLLDLTDDLPSPKRSDRLEFPPMRICEL